MSLRLSAKARTIALLCVAISIVLGAACSQSAGGRQAFVISESDSYEASLYRQNCAICHGREGYGRVTEDGQVPSLRFGEATRRSRAEIYKQIRHGKLPMPSFASQLSEEEIERMTDFVIRDLQGRVLPGGSTEK